MVNAGAVGQAERVRLTRPGNIATAGRRGRRPLRATARRRSRHIGQRMQFLRASQNGARAAPATLHTLGDGRRRIHRGKRGCCRSGRTGAFNPTRQSHSRGAPRTVHPTGNSETNVAAYRATDAIPPRLTKWCAGCARGISYVGRRTRDGRAVCIVIKIGHAEQMRLTRPGGLAATVHRGRCTLRAAA